jgi:hypothetical protein
VIFVEAKDEIVRESLAAFLDARFPGSVFDRETGLELDFRRPGMTAEVEVRIVERLLSAWHLQKETSQGTELLLTASRAGDRVGDGHPPAAPFRRIGDSRLRRGSPPARAASS